MIKGFTPRLYQETIFATAARKNTLVVLPTGMGKTNIFLMLAAQRLQQYPESKILLIGPTRPLIDQYLQVFREYFIIDEKCMAVLTGFTKPEKRVELWNQSKIIFSTPQGLENDILSEKISLENVSLLGIDEAHRTVKNYAYVWIAKQYAKKSKYPRIIGMTASPGSDTETILEVCRNLSIEEIEVRTVHDPDVRPYVQEIDLHVINVTLPPTFVQIRDFLSDSFKSKLASITEGKYLPDTQKLSHLNKSELLKLQAALHSQIAQGQKDYGTLKAISLLAEAMKVQHGLELIETQGIGALYNYMTKLQDESETTKVKAVKNLVRDLNFRAAYVRTKELFTQGIEHPKLAELSKLAAQEVAQDKDVKLIIFTQYRDSAIRIQQEMEKLGISAMVFVGQQKKGETGLSQKKQKQMLDDFRENKFNALIATSIGEEGLDIPKVDLVIFYEPVPSAIRMIQRRGRTGRQEKGRVVMLVASKTRDEAYRYVAQNKERTMYRIIDDVRKRLSYQRVKPDASLKKFIDEQKVNITVDHREKGSGIAKELSDMGAHIDLKTLDMGDYILSNRVAVEVKTTEDFVNSIVDGRLLSQIRDLRQNYSRPIVIIEGEADIYSVRKVHRSAIQGMVACIMVDYGVPIYSSRNSKETAEFLMVLAKREQLPHGGSISLHAEKKPLSLREQQEYVISSLPGIGSMLAKPLLSRFQTIRNIVNATEDELKEVELIGEKKAHSIRTVLDAKYEHGK